LRRFRGKPFQPTQPDIIQAFYWTDQALYVLDQRKLPKEEIYYEADTLEKVRKSIKDMLVRGAPAIGIVAAIGVYLGLKEYVERAKFPLSKVRLHYYFRKVRERLASARPTAVNLFWALNRLERVYQEFLEEESPGYQIDSPIYESLLQKIKEEVLKIWEEDLSANRKMGDFGAPLLPEGYILTHCNTGALATGGYGTALGVIRRAYEGGKRLQVWVDETRPFLQGARLTAWELSKLKIPYKIITDSAAGFLMKRGLVQAVIVGADRIALNGDTANKIGTYSLALLAKNHGIPFYVCAPSSTFDWEITSGEAIPIEERSEREILFCGKQRIAPPKAKAFNLAFDVTPGSLISAIITEKGVIYPPYEENIKRILGI